MNFTDANLEKEVNLPEVVQLFGKPRGMEARYVCPQIPCSQPSSTDNSVIHDLLTPRQGHHMVHSTRDAVFRPSAFPHLPDEKRSPFHLWTLLVLVPLND